MKPLTRFLTTSALLLSTIVLSSCGTTSTLKSASGGSITSTRTFSKVTVQDYTSTAGEDSGAATKHFADLIAAQIRQTGGFSAVSRNAAADASTLVIDGTITRYNEGNAALRLFVGMGAGSSYFDATTSFKDNAGSSLGQIVTDKNSWGLGGGLAASQTTETFMTGAAQKIAAEARKLAR